MATRKRTHRTQSDVPSENVPQSKDEQSKQSSKASIAKTVFDQMVDQGGFSRQQIIDKMMNDAEIGKAYASTLLYQFVQKTGKKSWTNRKGGKMDLCVKIIEEMWPKYAAGEIQPKDIKQRFVDEAGMSVLGAQSYWFKLKKQMITDEVE